LHLEPSPPPPRPRADVIPVQPVKPQPHPPIRPGTAYIPRLRPLPLHETLVPPASGDQDHWHLDTTGITGTLDDLAFLPTPEASSPLRDGQVRVRVRVRVHAAGLNFRDTLITVGRYPEKGHHLGGEGAGVVIEVGPGVTGFAIGDHAMGLLPRSMGPTAVTDQRLLVPIPAGWTYAQAAGAPI